jgi:hypothetical protein
VSLPERIVKESYNNFIDNPDLLFTVFDFKTLAQNFAIVEQEYFLKLDTDGFLNKNWEKYNQAPEYTKIAKRNNFFNFFIETMILRHNQKKKREEAIGNVI